MKEPHEMKKPNIIIISSVVFGLSYLLCVFINLNKAVDSISTEGFSVLVGIIVGIFGVLMGTITSLFSLFIESLHSSEINQSTAMSIIEDIDETVKELKQDTIFLVFALTICILIPIIRSVNFPIVAWFIPFSFFSRNIFLNTISLSLMILSFFAILDSICSMFNLYKAYSLITKERIKQILKDKNKS